ncbi:MAG: tRNA (adenosine(37)-N6)-threonylcarbamoyltransferase complex ATPase subunit type 1 TsaE [Synergistaceae bacterium]|nr:tRNA (adenosine(37)-N6)-threonylcarbamoyltransferase complex ATPase subunit type 1 TsaE [Synergistaceae bacterium]
MRCLLHSTRKLEIVTFTEEETRSLGRHIGKRSFPGLTILMHGGLGMGKTFLTQGIGSALGCGKIKSPTFILIAEHQGEIPLIHADLYRLNSYTEADALDFENYIDNGCVLVVEWAERWHTHPLSDTIDITINQYGDNEFSRVVKIKALGNTAENLLGALSSDILEEICEKEGNYESTGNRLHN